MKKTKGFVLKCLKYGDTSVIMHVYTLEYGMTAFIIKGFFTNKKWNQRHLQYPFSLVEITFRPNSKSDLHIPRQINLLEFYAEAHKHPVKLMILQFLSEILYFVLREDQRNEEVYLFIQTQLKIFDNKISNFAEFHLLFLAQLTRFLGFYPNMNSAHRTFFDLQEANFTEGNAQYSLSKLETDNWRKLYVQQFTEHYVSHFDSENRQQLTSDLLNYYKLHVPGFREPKSLEILKQILHA